MVGFLKSKRVFFIAIAIGLVLALLFLTTWDECVSHQPRVKSILQGFNSVHEEYTAYLDNCYPEIDVVTYLESVDTVLLHNLLLSVNRVYKPNYRINVYDSDSLLLYVEYTTYRRGDTIYHIVDHYEY